MSGKMTKCDQIYNYILEFIASNHLKKDDKIPTEVDLCEKFNVSRITVQGAIKQLQSEKKIYRIQGGGTYVGDIDSNHQPVIRNLSIIISHQANSFSLDIIQGAQAYLSQINYYLTVHISHKDELAERQIVTQLVENGAKCIMISPCASDVNNKFFFKLMQQGINFIFIDNSMKSLPCNVVESNNVMGGYNAGTYIAKNGYKNVAVFSIERIGMYDSLCERMEGLKMALDEHKITLDEAMIFECDNIIIGNMISAELHQKLEAMLVRPNRPDIIFALNDGTAIEILNYFNNHGISVPGEISVMGFDNLQYSAHSNPPLTTMNQNFTEIGAEAAKLAVELINDPDNRALTCKRIPVTLVERRSTRDLKKIASDISVDMSAG